MVYLDNAATAGYSDVEHVIVSEIMRAMKEYWQNPSSLYATNVKEKVDKCRANISKFINAKPNEIIFTSGASESNNAAIRGWVDNVWMTRYKIANIITTRIEHKSILEMLDKSNLDAEIYFCDVDEYGLVDYNSLENILMVRKNKPTLVSIHMANNEIGVIQPIKDISNLVHKYGGVLHIDATQAFGHIPIDVEELGVDMMSVSGHKISPVLKGIGFLYKKECINIQPLIYGSQELGLRGGTENTFGIIGLSTAIGYCDVRQEVINEMCKKRDYFINLLKSKFSKSDFECKLNGHSKQRLPNNINITLPQNVTGESLLYTLDVSGIQISTGSACNSSSVVPSHVLKEIGLTDEEAMKTIRITLPDDITYEEINYVVEEINKAIRIIEI